MIVPDIAEYEENDSKLARDTILNLHTKIDELDMRYRMAIALLVMWSNRHFVEVTEMIDKAIGHKYWNFMGSDKE